MPRLASVSHYYHAQTRRHGHRCMLSRLEKLPGECKVLEETACLLIMSSYGVTYGLAPLQKLWCECCQ